MILFALCTLGALIAVYVCTPAPKPVRTQYQHRHPEAGPMQKRSPQRATQRRTVRFED